MVKVISVGHRCSSSSFIKTLNLKTESYPFDWIVSKLDVVEDCIETNFVHFLNRNNYVTHKTETGYMIDNEKVFLCNEVAHVNTYYETNKDNRSTYDYKLALNHHNLDVEKDYQYYERCISRLYELFKTDIKKYYLYFHPFMGINYFKANKDNVLKEFDKFNNYIIRKTKNIFGLYFIMISHTQDTISVVLKETPTYKVFVIHAHHNLFTSTSPFSKELAEILSILRKNLI
jgi:hypothetical protein